VLFVEVVVVGGAVVVVGGAVVVVGGEVVVVGGEVVVVGGAVVVVGGAVVVVGGEVVVVGGEVVVVGGAVVVVVVGPGPVVLVVGGDVVVVVGGAVVVVDGGHGFGEHDPPPTLMPPWLEHPGAVVRMHESKAPPTEPDTQHWTLGCVVVVVDTAVVLVVGAPVVVVVVAPGQPPSELQASQQLDTDPTQALPPIGARHRFALRLMLHRARPLASVRQHVTKPSRPHVERPAHARISLRHAARTVPSRIARLAAWATHAM
jgi:hypothetical protein